MKRKVENRGRLDTRFPSSDDFNFILLLAIESSASCLDQRSLAWTQSETPHVKIRVENEEHEGGY